MADSQTSSPMDVHATPWQPNAATPELNAVGGLQYLVMAVDIERCNHTVIAIAAVLMSYPRRKEVRTFKTCGLFPEDMCGETYESFWCRDKTMKRTLESFLYEGDNTREEQQSVMIHEFQEFRKQCEHLAAEHGVKLITVVDSTTDVTFLSHMIMKYIDRDGYLPMTASMQCYSTEDGDERRMERTFDGRHLEHVGSMEHAIVGILVGIGAVYDSNEGDMGAIIRNYFDLRECTYDHDHDPLNDAYGIAWDYMNALDSIIIIRDGLLRA